MKLIKNLYTFILNPKSVKEEDVKFLAIVKEFLIYDFIITFSWAFLITLLTMFFEDFALVFKSKKTINETVINILIISVIIAPLVEEFAYRFSLKINRLSISISLSVQLIIYLHLFNLINITLYYRLLLMLITSTIFYFLISKKLSIYLNRKFTIYLYFNLLIFCLLHALNFQYLEIYHYLFIPVLISLQFFFGLYLSYARLKYNFLYVIGFHITHNAFLLGLSSLVS